MACFGFMGFVVDDDVRVSESVCSIESLLVNVILRLLFQCDTAVFTSPCRPPNHFQDSRPVRRSR